MGLLSESHALTDSPTQHLNAHNQAHEKLNTWVDVMADFGAAGDGVTDDTAAIQNAIDTAADIVYFPAGTFNHGELTFAGGQTILGEGRTKTTLSYTGSGTAISQDNAGTRIYGVTFKDFLLSTSTGSVGVLLNSVSSSRFENVQVNGFTTGWQIVSPTSGFSVYNTFIDCVAQSCGTGFDVQASGSNEHRFIACRANVCSSYGWKIVDSNHNVLIDCAIESGGVGLYVEATSNALSDLNTAAFCRFESNTTAVEIASSNVRDASIVFPLFSGNSTDLSNSGTRTALLERSRWLLPAYHEFTERSDPSAPSTNNVRLYAKDNGAGKTQLVARFPTGAVQVLATEP